MDRRKPASVGQRLVRRIAALRSCTFRLIGTSSGLGGRMAVHICPNRPVPAGRFFVFHRLTPPGDIVNFVRGAHRIPDESQ